MIKSAIMTDNNQPHTSDSLRMHLGSVSSTLKKTPPMWVHHQRSSESWRNSIIDHPSTHVRFLFMNNVSNSVNTKEDTTNVGLSSIIKKRGSHDEQSPIHTPPIHSSSCTNVANSINTREDTTNVALSSKSEWIAGDRQEEDHEGSNDWSFDHETMRMRWF